MMKYWVLSWLAFLQVGWSQTYDQGRDPLPDSYGPLSRDVREGALNLASGDKDKQKNAATESERAEKKVLDDLVHHDPGLEKDSAQLTQQQTDDIIQRFVAKATKAKIARGNFGYKQYVEANNLFPARDGEFSLDGERGHFTSGDNLDASSHRERSEVIFTPNGPKSTKEKSIWAPTDTFQGLLWTPLDDFNIKSILAFMLSAKKRDRYNVVYKGTAILHDAELLRAAESCPRPGEKPAPVSNPATPPEDSASPKADPNLKAYVFLVYPKAQEKGRRYFEGYLYVDLETSEILESFGKPVPEPKDNVFPRFKTIFNPVYGNYSKQCYRFPSQTLSLDMLETRDGMKFPIREFVSYTDYIEFGGRGDVEVEVGDAPAPDPSKKEQKQ